MEKFAIMPLHWRNRSVTTAFGVVTMSEIKRRVSLNDLTWEGTGEFIVEKLENSFGNWKFKGTKEECEAEVERLHLEALKSFLIPAKEVGIEKKEISWKSGDNSLLFRMEFKEIRPYRYYKNIGKSWPKTTQALLYRNGLLIGFADAVLHTKDTDIPVVGYKEAARKVMGLIPFKDVRKELWGQIENL